MASPTDSSTASGAVSGAASGAGTGGMLLGPWGALAGAVVGGAVGAFGSITAGNAAAAASKYKAGIAQLNTQISQQNANWSLESGDIKGMESGLQSGQQIAQTKVVQSGSGFDVTTGTNQTVRDTQTKAAQFDQNVIAWDASKTAWGFEAKAATDTAQANLDTMAAGTEKQAGEIGAVSSFLGGATSVASKWSQASQTGMTGGSSGPITLGGPNGPTAFS